MTYYSPHLSVFHCLMKMKGLRTDQISAMYVTSKGWRVETGLVHVQYTEGVACGYHKVEHLRLRIYSLHITVL